MIKGKIIKNKEGHIYHVSVKGHADFSDHGKDIVCSAISVYLTNTINTLTEIVKVDDYLEYEVETGNFLLNVNYSNLTEKETNETALILESLKLALTLVEDSYGKYIKIVTEEVQ
ncbi:MAG: ribosomal-processing cysteine protease Prp [Lagierella massiliensis]|nr:ribosomal-processing cysteine protease Prp [Lagierella massiliensis]